MSAIAPIHHFLSTPLVQSLLATHPNDVHLDPPPCLSSAWISLVQYYTHLNHADLIPQHIRTLIDTIRALQLDRLPIQIQSNQNVPIYNNSSGMSPKKSHEVSRMTAYISRLIASLHVDPAAVRIVDIGAGQGYLTRALKSHLHAHILALDADQGQTNGAIRWEARLARGRKGGTEQPSQGSIKHKTIHITPETLYSAIDDWIASIPSTSSPSPVLLVALHACGSLTPDILRSFLSLHRANHTLESRWTPIAVVAVGCCYNLMAPADFPLSRALSTSVPLRLPPSAFHLATQLPSEWLRTPESTADAKLAVRKVVWRALLAGLLQREESEGSGAGTGSTPEMKRLGRLNDAAYVDWETFLARARERVGCVGEGRVGAEREVVESRLEVLHVLRCLLGPLVESLIIADREQWVREELGGGEMAVEVINLFDQATGSGRNVAIVVAPASRGAGGV